MAAGTIDIRRAASYPHEMLKRFIYCLAAACMIISTDTAPGEATVKVVPRPDYPPSAIRLSRGWEYIYVPIRPVRGMDYTPASPPIDSTGWKALHLRDPSGFTPETEYWTRIRLPDNIPRPGGLYAAGWSPVFACYLSDSLIATHVATGPVPDNIRGGPEWYVITLPPEAAGQMLYLWRPYQEALLDLERSVVAPLSEPSGWKWIVPLENFILRSLQRGDLGYLALGMIFLTIGVVALSVFGLRRESRDATLFFFSTMSIFFGSRYLINTYTVRFWAEGTDEFWDKAGTVIGYLSGISAFWFFRCFLGSGWRSTISWAASAYSALACVAVPLIIIYTDPALIPEISNIMVITCITVIIANICRPEMRRIITFRSLLAGMIASGLCIILDNLRGLGMLLLPFSLEWLGILVIYMTVGLLTAHRIFTREQHLVAIRQELRSARQIQASILPREAPASPGLAIASRYIPMAEVAGDFYDFISLDENRHGMLVADVSGHGISAALIASMIKVAFHAQTDHAEDPGEVLLGINQSLSGQLGEQFVTAAYAYIDAGSCQLRYAGAAHPPLLIASAARGTVETVDNNGMMIGPFPDATYTGVTRRLEPGDRIVMYTDGILETVNPKDEEYGEERLNGFIAAALHLSVEEFADKLLEDVASWRGSNDDEPAEDDLTVVAIDFRA